MLRKVILAVVIISIFSMPAISQIVGSFPKSADNQTKSSFSLLDPGKFSMTQSYSLMYSSSSSGSQSLGFYLNSLEYQISDPLKIRVDIGYLHNAGALVGNSNGSLANEGVILPGASITWKPSENFLLHFNYRQMPNYYNFNDRDNSGYWYPETGRGN